MSFSKLFATSGQLLPKTSTAPCLRTAEWRCSEPCGRKQRVPLASFSALCSLPTSSTTSSSRLSVRHFLLLNGNDKIVLERALILVLLDNCWSSMCGLMTVTCHTKSVDGCSSFFYERRLFLKLKLMD